jgi:NADPH-dependent glutamate synthase beta subunit-like oxidoreductase/dihydroorotate dehydrogenase/Pyruvate/2-oxoacid:ferredoxin oxidoreductase delta subunit
MGASHFFLTGAQLAVEMERCLFCEEKPCKAACPADCSPADFIIAARGGHPSDFRRAAAMIMAANPLGGVCGGVCPDTHCMAACARTGLDRPVEIPAVQATIIARARELRVMPALPPRAAAAKQVAVVGGGPAGYGAASVLSEHGVSVTVFERESRAGGMASLIPSSRLDARVLEADIAFVEATRGVDVRRGEPVGDPVGLLDTGFDAVVVAAGLGRPIHLGINFESLTWTAFDYLADPRSYSVKGLYVAVVGGGAVAADCAEVALAHGAAGVELFTLEALGELPLTGKELAGIMTAGVHVSGRTRVTDILTNGERVAGVRTLRVELPAGERFHPRAVVDVAGTELLRREFEVVIVAIGGRPSLPVLPHDGVFFAGDIEHGPTTVVEAVAAGKNTAVKVLGFLGLRSEPETRTADVPLSVTGGQGTGTRAQRTDGVAGNDGGAMPAGGDGAREKVKSTVLLSSLRDLPVPLDADFFGTPILSPFLLSAAPPSDGFDQMRKAYEAGWAGGVMKTAFDGVPIHIPAGYMFPLGKRTFGNCDNVSGHALDRVCGEIERLRREFPDRLTLGSTGGPVTGNDDADARVWLANTRRLEAAGACGIEYSLSCPQGGDGTKGDIVSQDAELTARIVEWVLSSADPSVPKLFKLTAAVTAIVPIIAGIKEVLARHPHAKAGVTLANTFPAMSFRPGQGRPWDEGVVVGMSGEAVAPISYFTLARVSSMGVTVSGNAGPMDYRAAANFLALGCRTVQFCTIVMKYGVGIVDELHSGLSYLLESRGMCSVADLIGCALPEAITPFEHLSAVKAISAVDRDLCIHCGNCTRCPYLAISLEGDLVPHTDAARCVGCTFCTLNCPSGALAMRARSPEETAALCEG